MATKTYLQLVNSVLTRLRETNVATVSETTYSALIGEWVNDAKRLVEDAWDWRGLTTSVTVPIVASTLDYTLSTLNERARLLRSTVDPRKPLAFDTTSVPDGYPLEDVPFDWIREQRAIFGTTNTQAKPTQFGLSRTPSAVVLGLWEVPTGSRTWSIYFVDPQDDLDTDTTTIGVPYAPVVQIALEYALNERGEEIGEPGTTVEQRAQMHIANAIAIDAMDRQDKLTLFPS